MSGVVGAAPSPEIELATRTRTLWAGIAGAGRSSLQRPAVIDRLALGAVALQALCLFFLMAPGSWWMDDFENLSMAQHSPLTRAYLSRTVFGHPEPGARLVNWFLVRAFPMQYVVVAALSALAIAATSWMVYRILRLLFEPSVTSVVLAWIAGSTALWLPPAMWWSAGVQLAACVLTSVLACHALVRCYLGSHRLLWAVASGGWLVVGLLFYEQVLFGGLFCAVFLPAAVCRRLRFEDIAKVVRRAWPAYAAIACVCSAYVVIYLRGHYVRRDSHYSTHALVAMLWRSWGHTLTPGMLGGPLHWKYRLGVYGIARSPEWWIVLGQLAVVAVAVAGIRMRGRRSLRGWLLFVPLFVAAQYSIATARLAIGGPAIGDETRYVVDMAPIAALALGLVLLRPRGQGPEPEREPGSRAPTPLGYRPRLVVAGVVVVATSIVFGLSAVPAARTWAYNPSSRYVADLRRSLGQADRAGPWSLYDTLVPETVMHQTYVPYSTIGYVAQLVTDRAVSTNDASRRLLVVDDAGNAVPARFAVARSVRPFCAERGRRMNVVVFATPLESGQWFLDAGYSSSGRTTLDLAIDPGTGRFISATSHAHQLIGSGRIIVNLRTSPVARLRLTTTGPSACLSDVALGRPVP
ncbi:MAG TPA: hypothetical protein VGL39_23770 [Jatrophihabitantaceae bacterium]